MAANLKDVQSSIAEKMGVSLNDLHLRKAFIGFGQEDIDLLRELSPLVKKHADRFTDEFYKNIGQHPELLQIIQNAGSNIERLKSAQSRYLTELFAGEYELPYVERRLKIGVVHNNIGLTPRWYLGSYAVYIQLLTPLVQHKYRFSPGKAGKALNAVYKILMFDAQLAIDTYIYSGMEDYKAVSTSKELIDNTVKTYRDFIEEVAQGNLSQRLSVTGSDNLSQLGNRLNAMTESLAEMASQIKGASSVLAETTEEVQESVIAQSAGASEQAAAISEATSSLEQIRAISAHTQEKVAMLGTSADRTRIEGENGMKLVEEAVHGMETIRDKVEGIATNIIALSEQTQQIGEITGTVNNLAQQLKMLALNASIEASKAGEAGKGFAVVAAEVRDLAEQSQQATQQVHTILQEIQRATDKAVMVTEQGSKEVDEGMNLVKQAGDAVKQLTRVIHESSTASQQIVASVKQEAIGIDQITVAMAEINQATGQFVASSEQTQKSVTQLNEMAKQMSDSIKVYRL